MLRRALLAVVTVAALLAAPVRASGDDLTPTAASPRIDAAAYYLVGADGVVLARHDADFERLEVGDSEVTVEARDASKHTRFVAHRQWTRLVLRERGGRCTLGLAYAGKTVPLGRMLSDEGRRQLAERLRGTLPVTAA